MEVVFQIVGISIPHSMEILKRKPLRLEDLLRSRQAEAVQKTGLELIVGHAILLAAAYVVASVPELLRHPVFAHLCEQTARILYGRPLQDACHRHVEGGRIHDLEDARIQDAGLPKRHPAPESRLGEHLFRAYLREGVHVIFSRSLRFVDIAPMTRIVPVAILCYRAYVYDSHVVLVRLSEDCLHDIFCSGHIDLEGLFRIIICCRRDHSSDMEDIVRSLYAFKHIFISCEVTPDHRHRRV